MKPLVPLLSVATDYSDVTNRHLGIWSKNPSLAPSLHCAGPRSRSISRFLQQAASPSLGPGPGPDQRLHTRAGLLSPQVSQAWSCESEGRSCAKGPRSKSWPLLGLGEARRSYIYENTGKSFQHSHKPSMSRS